jgi:hypothetical protein
LSSRLVHARLLETIIEMEKDVSLNNFTSNEQQVYAAIFLLSNNTDSPVSIHDIKSHGLVCDVPMPNSYRSFNLLIKAKKYVTLAVIALGFPPLLNDAAEIASYHGRFNKRQRFHLIKF